MEHRPGPPPLDAGSLGIRRSRDPTLVLRGRSLPRRCEPNVSPVFRQLQHPEIRRLVSDDIADHDRELEGVVGPTMDDSRGGRYREDDPHREGAEEDRPGREDPIFRVCPRTSRGGVLGYAVSNKNGFPEVGTKRGFDTRY